GVTIDGAVTGSLEFGDESAVNADFAGRLDLDPAGVLRRFDLRRLTASASDIRFAGNVFNVDGLRLSLAGTPEAFAGNAQATLSSASFAAAGLALIQPTLSLEAALAYRGDELSLSLATGTSLDAASLTVTGLAPLALHVETVGESTVAIARDGRLRHDLRLALPAMKIETPSLAATVTLPDLRLMGVLGERYSGSAEISGGAVELPGRDLALDGIDASLDLDEGKLRGDFSVRELRHPAAAPLAASGSFDLAEGVMDFSGRLTDGGALTLNLTGRHALATGTGGVSVEMARLALDPDGTQPGDLAPGLRGLAADVRGTIAAVARFAWDSSSGGDGLTSEATLLVEDLSLDVGGLRFERVNSVIAFDSLWPLSTAPAQQLAIGLIDAGLPLTDGIIDFQLRPDGALYVENAVWRWAGGRLKTRNFLFDPDAERHAFTLEVDDLDLAEIVALSDMEDISASGRLSGRVPVTVTAEGLAISGGRLETAEGGGFLRYAPEVAPAMLRQGGEGASLALNVLENFRYESLRIEIDRDAGGDAEIAVHLRGSNADVYDGFPIEFNLNISGPIDQMLRRGLEGYRVPDAVAEKLRGFGGQ
ncbi:MAG: YdbH domain-containing protein, partial [Proteobacteria bacterium]|nr:YdbH domain-containing protein [Pseudomonadota bacterium]